MRSYRQRRKNQALKKLGCKCKFCNSLENLEFDHIDPRTKKSPISRLWVKSQQEIDDELKQCQLLCKTCHTAKSKQEGSLSFKGDKNPASKLTNSDIPVIRKLKQQGLSARVIASRFNVSHVTILNIVNKKAWI